MGELQLKGKATPVRAFQVVGQLVRERVGAAVDGPRDRSTSTMVGRDRELAALLEVTASDRGSGPIAVTIRGEPGVGKSRLLTEWRERSKEEGDSVGTVQWAVTQCLPYGQQMANQAVVESLFALTGSSLQEGERSRDQALRRTCERLFPGEWRGLYASLAHLCAVPLSDDAMADLAGLDAQALRSLHARSMGRLMGRLAEQTRLVIALEDVHWIDQASAELLAESIARTSRASPTWVFTTRPAVGSSADHFVRLLETIPIGRSQEVRLAPLSESAAGRLVEELLEGLAWPTSRANLVRKRAEGNPLFAEELVRMLRERSGGEGSSGEEPDHDIPATLHGLLLSRIDGLSPDLRETVRVAAVIGRRFPARVLARVRSP